MMVTQYDDERLFATMQTDHSRVAGFLAANWGNEDFSSPSPWNAVVIAAQEHDRGWWLWETKPTLNDQGKALDYHDRTLHHLGEQRLDIYRTAVNDVITIDPYAGVLVLDHLSGLLDAGGGAYSFRKDFSAVPMVQQFLQQQLELKKNLLRDLAEKEPYRDYCHPQQLQTNFKLLEIIDQLAQLICNRYPLTNNNRGVEPNTILREFPVPTRPGEDDALLQVTVLDETHLRIEPFPFVKALKVSYVGRLLPNRSYQQQDDFLKDFYGAETVAIQYELVP